MVSPQSLLLILTSHLEKKKRKFILYEVRQKNVALKSLFDSGFSKKFYFFYLFIFIYISTNFIRQEGLQILK
jgi:hypothetical protein